MPSDQSLPKDRTAQQAAIRWLLAGLAAVAVGTIMMAWGGLGTLPMAMEAVVAAACGWLTLILLAPWRALRRLHDERPAIRLLADRLQSCLAEGRETPLSELILDRDDELGDLSRSVHDLAAKISDLRRENRMIHRRMGDSIRKETNRATAQLQKQAATDPLTGLGNRRALEQRLESLLGVERDPERLLTVMAVDLDHFKAINDTLGHEVGDRCLTFLADLLKSSLRRDDCAIRLGGDEFCVLLSGATSRDIPRPLALLRARRNPQDEPIVPFSVGAASYDAKVHTTVADLVAEADSAMYQEKGERRGDRPRRRGGGPH
jgi:diguanylate cyclase (GGDEF)-like protein